MLALEDKKYLLALARNTIKKAFGLPADNIASTGSPILQENRGTFVTLHKQGRLRGCIGYIKAIKPLGEAILDMAISAAFRDTRFNPLTADEVPDIDIEISVLSPIEAVKNIDEIEVGKHGLIITQGARSGLLLPQVAPEWGWNRDEFLKQTCNKAGLPADAWQHGAMISCFTADVFGELAIYGK